MALYVRYQPAGISGGGGGGGPDFTIGPIDSQPANANGLTLVGTVLSTQSADATHPGMVNNLTQTFSGAKTFTSEINIVGTTAGSLRMTSTVADATNKFGRIVGPQFNNADTDFLALDIRGLSGATEIDVGGGSGILNAATLINFFTAANNTTLSGTSRLTIDSTGLVNVVGNETVGGTLVVTGTIGASNFSGSSSGTNTGDVTLTAVGASPNANAATLTGQALNLQPFSSSFPGVVTASGGGSTNFLRADGTWAAPSGTGISSVSVASANGLAGTSSGGTTPTLTLSTTITGILQGNGTAISAASTTGSGAVVLANTPTLITPVIGAATGTSLTVTGLLNSATLGVGTTTPGIYPNSSTLFAVVSNTSNTNAAIAAYGTSASPALRGFSANGTVGSPTASQSTDPLFVVGAHGYGATGFSAGSRGSLNFLATQNWTDTAQGTQFTLKTTPNGTAASVVALTIDQDQSASFATTVHGRMVRTATAVSYVALTTDTIVGVTSTAATRTITLPSSATAGSGFELIVKDESGAAGTNNITVSRAGSDTIDGATTVTISVNYGVLKVYSDGAGKWFTL